MGINWSDMMYPDNPKRRDEVNKLAQSIRTSVISIYSNVRTVSISLHQACEKFMVLPDLTLDLTFKQSFDLIQKVMDQWKSTTEELKMDPKIPSKIKDLMKKFEKVTSAGQFPSTVKDIVSDPVFNEAASVGSAVVGLVAGVVVGYFIHLSMASLVTTTLATMAIAGIAGSLIGAGIGILAGLIIGAIDGAIEGAREREELEQLEKKYQAMDDQLHKQVGNLEKDVAYVQRAIIKALPDDE